MSKLSGFTLTLPCLWQSILTALVVQCIERSEELVLFAIFWGGKPLFRWYVPSFSVVWTIATLYWLTPLLIKCTALKNQNHAATVVFRKSRHEPVTPLLKKLHWLPVKERILFKIATSAFLWWYPATIIVILSLCVHSISYSPFQFRWKNSFLCKMETPELWSPVVQAPLL